MNLLHHLLLKSSGICGLPRKKLIRKEFQHYIEKGVNSVSHRPNQKTYTQMVRSAQFSSVIGFATPQKVIELRTTIYNYNRLFSEKEAKNYFRSLKGTLKFNSKAQRT